jgi:NadR type nicotinamide-nucleotide adenylyltransferase
LIRRVVLTGSECTGKSTLATELARALGGITVPEFVREFAERKGAPITFEDHGAIARGQVALEDRCRREAEERDVPILIQDTDLLSTTVYCLHYFGECPEWIATLARERRPDLYLLMDIDLPWVADAVRDRGDRRDEMQALFREAVQASGVPFVEIRGRGENRLARALEAIDTPSRSPNSALP